MTTRTIAGLQFEALSPSLYTCEVGKGTVAIQYEGAGMWAIRCLTLDTIDEPHYFPSLAAIEAQLNLRQTG